MYGPFAPRQSASLALDEHTLLLIIDAIPQKVWAADVQGTGFHFNKQWCDYTDCTSEALKEGGWQPLLHPDDWEDHRHVMQHAFASGEDLQLEERLRRNDGVYRWHVNRGVAQRDNRGEILLWVGTCTDIDDQKSTEQTLKAREEYFRALAETVPQLVWMTRPDGYTEYLNQRMSDYMNTTPEQLLGTGWFQFLHPDDYERTLAARRHALATGEHYEIEYRLRNGRTGEYRWFLARGIPVRDEHGTFVKLFGTCTDIDDQKRIEEDLRHSQERARKLMDSNIIGILIADGDDIVEANDAFLHMTGYTREDLHKRRMNRFTMTPPEDMPLTEQAFQEMAAHRQVMPYEIACICKDGSRLPILVGVVELQHDPPQYIAFVLDNSARKELEQRKDDFISMASHELRTPLTSLKLQTQLLKRNFEKQGSHDSAAALEKMEAQVNTLTELVAAFLDVSKIQAGRLEYAQETVDLSELLRDLAEVMQQTSPTHTIHVHGAAHALLVGDKNRLGQVFTNLVSNAIKYSPGADAVDIDVTLSDETVTVSVRDYGIGILREQQSKIFDRFYRAHDSSTKAFPGLGMGLYISSEIVKRHGGTITVDTEVGKGSTLQVALPLKGDTNRSTSRL
jgi:PAS domain S-box-containing protein